VRCSCRAHHFVSAGSGGAGFSDSAVLLSGGRFGGQESTSITAAACHTGSLCGILKTKHTIMYNKELFYNEKLRNELFNAIFESVRRSRHEERYYVVNGDNIFKLIDNYFQDDNLEGICCIVEIIFWESGQGRRPWSVDAENAFVEKTNLGTTLFKKLKNTYEIPVDFYRSLFEKLGSSYILYARNDLEKRLDNNNLSEEEASRYENYINCFDDILQNHSIIALNFIKDYPEDALNFDKSIIIELLEFVDDNEFEQLLTRLSETRKLKAREILEFYKLDDEDKIKKMSNYLLQKYY